MKVPALPNDNIKTRFAKYVGEIEFAVFSIVFSKNIWSLQNTSDEDSYRSILVNANHKRTYEQNKLQENYITLQYLRDESNAICTL